MFGKMKDDGEELHGNRRSARRVVGRDLTESGVGSAVLCPGYMFLHLSCECEVGAGSVSVGSCAVGEVGGRVVSRHPSDFAWRVVVGGGKGRSRGWFGARTLRSTLDRWLRILPSTGSFWMKRHFPAPYFFTPLRSASSSSGDHCGEKGW